jgi:hypothetical protein
MNDMEHPWSHFILEALSMLQYGWAYHEICYKNIEGGGLGWSKLPIRAQSTLDHWGTDDRNNITGMWQQDPYTLTSNYVFIPIEKAIHFTTTPAEGNPEGRSILRSAVRSYNFLKRLQEVEAIGIERELAGFPVLHVPLEYLDANAPSHIRNRVAGFKRMLMSIRRDEREGVIMPAEDTGGAQSQKSGFKFELLAGGGKRAIDTNVVITRYETRIATTMLAQFILLGTGGAGGSFALADSQASVFTIALFAALMRIADEVNRKLIPDLCELNGFSKEDIPKLRPEKLQDVSLATLATFVNQLVATNVLQPDDDLEDHLRKIADLPKKGEPREDPAHALMEKEAELNPLPVGGPEMAGSNPHGAGKPKAGEGNTRKDPGRKKTDPKDTTGKDRVNVRTERTRKTPK